MTGSRPHGPPPLIFGTHEDGTRQPHTPRCPAVPGGGQHRVILAGIQAVRPRCAAGAPPGPRLRVTHAQPRPRNTRKTGTTGVTTDLTDPALSGMTDTEEPRVWWRF